MFSPNASLTPEYMQPPSSTHTSCYRYARRKTQKWNHFIVCRCYDKALGSWVGATEHSYQLHCSWAYWGYWGNEKTRYAHSLTQPPLQPWRLKGDISFIPLRLCRWGEPGIFSHMSIIKGRDSLVPRPRVPPGKNWSGERSQISWAYYPKRVMTNEIPRSVIIT